MIIASNVNAKCFYSISTFSSVKATNTSCTVQLHFPSPPGEMVLSSRRSSAPIAFHARCVSTPDPAAQNVPGTIV